MYIIHICFIYASGQIVLMFVTRLSIHAPNVASIQYVDHIATNSHKLCHIYINIFHGDM